MYQKCPLCEGSGEIPQNLSLTNTVVKLCCAVCDGARIISSLTGAPPKAQKNNKELISYRVDLVDKKLVITDMYNNEKVVCSADADSCYIYIL